MSYYSGKGIFQSIVWYFDSSVPLDLKSNYFKFNEKCFFAEVCRMASIPDFGDVSGKVYYAY